MQHTISFSGAKIIYHEARIFPEQFQRFDMPYRQIDHMDVIPHPGSVSSRVIVRVYRKMIQSPDSHLCDIRHQIIGYAIGVFADESAGVCTDGVKIAQQRNVKIGMGEMNVF